LPNSEYEIDVLYQAGHNHPIDIAKQEGERETERERETTTDGERETDKDRQR